MTTRRNSRQGYGSVNQDEHRNRGRRSSQESRSRYGESYEEDFENTKGAYGDDSDDQFFSGRRDQFEEDDRRSGSRYEDDFDTRQDQQRTGGLQGRGRRADDEDIDSYRNTTGSHYSRRGFGSMKEHPRGSSNRISRSNERDESRGEYGSGGYSGERRSSNQYGDERRSSYGNSGSSNRGSENKEEWNGGNDQPGRADRLDSGRRSGSSNTRNNNR